MHFNQQDDAMPLARALKSFSGKLGMIRKGSTFHADPTYFDQLRKKGYVEQASASAPAPTPSNPDPNKQAPGPVTNKSIPAAPNKASDAGKEKEGSAAGTGSPSVQRPAGGKGTKSASLRADLPSLEKIATPSDSGENAASSSSTNDPASNPAGE